MLLKKVVDKFAKNLSHPQSGIYSYFVKWFFIRKNCYLEHSAVDFLKIEPHQKILEIGFGPGLGLEYAVKFVEKGDGSIWGLELSREMLFSAFKRLDNHINNGKIILIEGNVERMPFCTDWFHHCFHVNCYYFWTDIVQGCSEVYRVLRPGGKVITALNLQSLEKAQSRGFMKYGKPNPLLYTCALESVGFQDISVLHDCQPGSHQIITATKPLTTSKAAASPQSSNPSSF